MPTRTQAIDHAAPSATDVQSSTAGAAAGQSSSQDIAIIGVSGRYPQADDWRQLWKVLAGGIDCISEIPPQRWDHQRYFDATRGKAGRTYGKWGGFIAGHDEFDPLFFNIAPRDAELMDPQERLFLQAAWHAIEDAGYRRSALAREPVGVFAGVMWAHYQLNGVSECLAGQGAAPTALHASIANRVSYSFDFRGPSIALDTMCSSSLTALHLACDSLRRGECHVALAGGVNLCTHPIKYQLLAQNSMLASDGRCRSFGAGGDGYVPGEGVGVLLLKPLERALQDGDHVYGVIKASAINHGGKTNGYTVPNPLAQGQAIRQALQNAALNPAAISYLEAHGTGTALGDPIEINGLQRAFAEDVSLAPGSIALGSVKSNIGHLESAAGVAAISKVLLQFEHEQIAPSLHADRLNPNIDFSASPLRVAQVLEAWPRSPHGEPRRAGVSSFGAGGSNAHVILEEAPPRAASVESDAPQLIVLSARQSHQLQAAARQLAAWLADQPSQRRPSLADIAWTLQLGREEMQVRAAFVARDHEEMRQLAQRLAEGVSDDARLLRGEQSELSSTLRSVLDGPAGQTVIDQMLAASDLPRLAELWVTGFKVDWRRLHATPRCRVPLPGYAFARQRFWVPNVSFGGGDETLALRAANIDPALAASPVKSQTVDQAQPEDLLLVRDWRAVDRLAATDEFATAREPGLLLVHAQCPAAFIAQAQQRGWRVVRAGDCLQFEPQGISTLDFTDADQGRALASRLLDQPSQVECVVDMVDVHADSDEAWTVPLGRMALLQTCLKSPSGGALQWLHLTQGLHPFAHDCPNLNGAAMSGLVKMLSAEYSRMRAQTADVEHAPESFDGVLAVLSGMHAGTADEVEVCYRGAVRYVPGMRRLRVAPDASPPAIHADRAYLITGGTSGIGLEIARHLVSRGARRLALMGINPLPPREQWQQQMASGDDRTRQRLQALLAFEQAGVQVETHFGALDDAAAVQAFIARVADRLGPIAGVVHSATASFNRPDPYFINKSADELRSVLAPKVAGTRHLSMVLQQSSLDFFVLFSSVASALPSRGQGVSHYAMANTFLDRFAEHQAAMGKHAVKCINWVYWGEAGGVAGADNARKLARYDIFPQTIAEGLASFDQVLSMQAPRALAGRLGESLRREARLDDAEWRETSLPACSPSLAMLERCTQQHERAVLQLQSQQQSQRELSDYAALSLLRSLRDAGVLIEADRVHGTEQLAVELGVVPTQRRLWTALLGMLARKRFIQFTDRQHFMTAGTPGSDTLRQSLAQLSQRAAAYSVDHPQFAPYVRLIDAACGGLLAVLRGERSATDVLFPGGSVELVEAVYRGNPISDHFNDQLARVAAEWLGMAAAQGRSLRVLEVGAGTGGTSARVLEALRPLAARVEYVYTDISARFIRHGEERFGSDHPFARFQVLDIERDAQAQDVGEPFDLVLATNVIHATRDLTRTLAQVQQLLRPGGLFLLNELTELHDFATVTFGLLEGWWQFDDAALRLADAPLLSESSWRAVLAAAGLEPVKSWRLPSLTAAEGDYQTLFAALSTGRRLVLPLATAAGVQPVAACAASPGAQRVPTVAAASGVPPADTLANEATPVAVPLTSLEHEVALIFAGELKIPAGELRFEVGFGEYGVDSILMGSLVRALEQRLDVAINPSLLLEHNTIASLSRRLRDEHPAAVALLLARHQPAVELPDTAPSAIHQESSSAGVVRTASADSAMSNAAHDSVRSAAAHGDQHAMRPAPTGFGLGRGWESIAVIGMACEFPQAPNLQSYWWNLKEGRCGIREVPASRWSVEALYSPQGGPGRSASKWGGFLDQVDQFDPEFFKFRAADAPVLNPLIRKSLECAVQAVRHAGYEAQELWGQRAGVFVGSRVNEYGLALRGQHKNRILGAGQNFIAAHVSQFFNLSGPSLLVDSACSSSLVSLYLACQSLLSGDSDLALAAGVDLLLDERPYLILSEMGALSPEGRCRVFDESANGFVPGEGCGVVLLKRLDAALRDGDRIHAVIDGAAINNDGHTMGVTTPSPDAQSAVISEALARGGIDPRSVGYVETHGTGTLVGDPIELQALTRVLAGASGERQFCGVGSVKSNFGHLLSAAGVASFIKVVLGLGAGKLAPTLFCDTPNPRFSFASSPLYPVRKLQSWPRHAQVRRAGVSSFGLGGTNAHVVVSEAPQSAAAAMRRPLLPVVFNRRRFWSEPRALPMAVDESSIDASLELIEATLDL